MIVDERSKRRAEALISEGVVRFELQHMGRGPEDARTYLLDDMVIVRLRGVLTPAEKQLAQKGIGEASAEERGRTLVKQMRTELIERASDILEGIILSVLGRTVRSMHTDISTVTGERVIVFILGEEAREPSDAQQAQPAGARPARQTNQTRRD